MIELYQVLLLALVQGLTEFLPISSSAHLVIPPLLLGWPDQGLAFDVAVHVGTLSAGSVVDADGLLVLPGGVDTHVHFNDIFMNTVSVHDYHTGTRAAAALPP